MYLVFRGAALEAQLRSFACASYGCSQLSLLLLFRVLCHVRQGTRSFSLPGGVWGDQRDTLALLDVIRCS